MCFTEIYLKKYLYLYLLQTPFFSCTVASPAKIWEIWVFSYWLALVLNQYCHNLLSTGDIYPKRLKIVAWPVLSLIVYTNISPSSTVLRGVKQNSAKKQWGPLCFLNYHGLQHISLRGQKLKRRGSNRRG